MLLLTKGLIGLAAVGFLLAVFTSLSGGAVMGIAPEAFSRACNNLSLMAIAVAVCFKSGAAGS